MSNFITVSDLIGGLENIANKELQVFVKEEYEVRIFIYQLTEEVNDVDYDDEKSIELITTGKPIDLSKSETSITVGKLLELLYAKKDREFIYISPNFNLAQVKALMLEKDRVILQMVEVEEFCIYDEYED